MPSLPSYAANASVTDRDRPLPPPGLQWLDGEAIPGQVCALESSEPAEQGLRWWALCDDGHFEHGPQAEPIRVLAARALIVEADRLALQALALTE